MLKSSLDVLRNKELSFGCYVRALHRCNHHNEAVFWIYISHTVVKVDHNGNDTLVRLFVDGKFCIVWSTRMQVLLNNYWHPLTRWRLYQLWHWRKPAYLEVGEPEYDRNEYNKFYLCFENIKDIFYTIWFDKTEIERMKHDKRNELYLLLIEFVQYFK